MTFICEMNFTFPQSYYISQLLTIDHDCGVIADKHDSGSKVKNLNFAITKSVVLV